MFVGIMWEPRVCLTYLHWIIRRVKRTAEVAKCLSITTTEMLQSGGVWLGCQSLNEYLVQVELKQRR